MEKCCTKCKENKLMSEFSIIRGYVQSWCKSCVKQNAKDYYIKNKNHIDFIKAERWRQRVLGNKMFVDRKTGEIILIKKYLEPVVKPIKSC